MRNTLQKAHREFYAGIRCVLLVLALFTGAASILVLEADTVVAPNENASVPGAGAQLPFASSGVRVQNVYNATEFLNAMPQGGLISQIAFRIDETDRSSFSATIPDLEIRISTSPAVAPNLSTTLALNVGPDETVVYPRGSTHFSVTGSNSGPNPFDLKFLLTTPFAYDPRGGSLCVDIFVYGQAFDHRVFTDANQGDDALARLGTIGIDNSDITRPALVLQLGFTPVPEPKATVLAMLAIAISCVFRRRSL